MKDEELDEELLMLARKIVQKKRGFMINLSCFILVNMMLILIWYTTGAGYFWPMWCIISWGFGLAVCAVDIVHEANSGGDYDKVEKEYQRLKRRR